MRSGWRCGWRRGQGLFPLLTGEQVAAAHAASALVLPELWPVALSLSEHCVPDADSAEYSMTRPGDDPSEPFGLREYPGQQAGRHLLRGR